MSWYSEAGSPAQQKLLDAMRAAFPAPFPYSPWQRRTVIALRDKGLLVWSPERAEYIPRMTPKEPA